jgi:hypothetical protein
MKSAHALTLALVMFAGTAALAQTPPTDPQSKQKESPSTMGTGAGGQGTMPEGEKPATDPQSKTDAESSTTMGMGKGDQGAEPTKKAPATDPTSKDPR